jgi:hypothetical protein
MQLISVYGFIVETKSSLNTKIGYKNLDLNPKWFL